VCQVFDAIVILGVVWFLAGLVGFWVVPGVFVLFWYTCWLACSVGLVGVMPGLAFGSFVGSGVFSVLFVGCLLWWVVGVVF
jgi:hypothetical protein